jgi:3-oxoacyl-[acyl-carrier protein] reductase
MLANEAFRSRVALITGCGSPRGIGYATARILAASGAAVALTSTTDRIRRRAESLRAAGWEAAAWVADLMDRDRAAGLVERVRNRFHRIDILINNAGMVQIEQPESFARLVEMNPAEWDLSIQRNLTTCFNVTHAVLPHMIRQQYGRIVNVASVTGPLVGNPGSSAYSAAKAAMVGMSRSLAIEVGGDGITVNSVAPGWIATGSSSQEELVAGRHTPVGRPGTPEEVGCLIAFLASEQASYITGQMLVVDGGNTIQEYKGPKADYY